jgi:hypothetical protein
MSSQTITLNFAVLRSCLNTINGEFDPGSGRTLATCLRNASRTR